MKITIIRKVLLLKCASTKKAAMSPHSLLVFAYPGYCAFLESAWCVQSALQAFTDAMLHTMAKSTMIGLLFILSNTFILWAIISITVSSGCKLGFIIYLN